MFFHLERTKRRLNLSNAALITVDVQNYFFDTSSAAYLPGAEKIIPVIEKLVAKFVEREKLVISTLHLGASKMMKEWWGNQVSRKFAVSSLTAEPSYVIYKDTYDAFHQTELEKILHEHQINQVVLTGVMTHLCVETTARSAFVRGYEVIVVEDATWDKSDWYHFASLKNLAHGFAIVCKAEEILCALE